MKLLVTGGAGFIGSHVVDGLLQQGHSVAVVDNLSTGRRNNVPPQARLIEEDIRDAHALFRILEEESPHVVLHLAAQMNVRRSLEDPAWDASINVLGSIHLFQACARVGVRRIVFASSGGAVYGERLRGHCRESDVPRPSSPYGIGKLAAEHYGRSLVERGGPEFTVLRLANVYGHGQNPAGEAGVVALFLREMKEGRSPVIFGGGDQTRDFVWVADVAEAFARALGAPCGIYNIGTGKNTSVLEIYDLLKNALAFQGEPRHLERISGEIHRNVLSITRARRKLGWTPKTELQRGLEEIVRRETGPRPEKPVAQTTGASGA